MNPAPREGGATLAVLAISVAMVFWSIGPLFVREISASSDTIVAFRVGLAVPVMIAAAYATGGRMSMRLLRASAVPGILFGTSLIAGFAAFKKTSIVNATLIPSLTPVIVLLFAASWLGERRTPKRIGWSIVALVGVAAVVLGKSSGGPSHLEGDLWAIADLAIWTAYMIVVKRSRDSGEHSWSLLAGIFVWSAVVCIPWSLAVSNDLGAFGGLDWVWIVCMIFGPGLIGHGLMTWAQGHIDLTISSLMTLSTPPMSAALAWAVHGESLTFLQVIGGILVLVGLGAIAVDTTSRPKPAPEPAAAVT